jgi:DNA invertase Pin-like site-specific DNA recombinase
MRVKYIRVSSSEQNIERQRDFPGEEIIDRCSGAIPFSERNGGGKIIELVKAGLVEEIYVHSLDRLGRSLTNILSTINFLSSSGCSIVFEKEGIRTLNSDGKENIATKLLISILGAVAESERELIRERQREGIDIAKRKGKFKGRKKGTGMTIAELLTKYKKVVNELNSGESLRRSASLAGVSLGTVQRVARAMKPTTSL